MQVGGNRCCRRFLVIVSHDVFSPEVWRGMTMDDLQVLILRNHNYFCFLFPDNSQASVMDRDRDIENLSGEHRDAARRVMSSALI